MRTESEAEGKYEKLEKEYNKQHIIPMRKSEFWKQLDCLHFVSRKKAEKLLDSQPVGSFLVRPSSHNASPGRTTYFVISKKVLESQDPELENQGPKRKIKKYDHQLIVDKIVPKVGLNKKTRSYHDLAVAKNPPTQTIRDDAIFVENLGRYIDKNYDTSKALINKASSGYKFAEKFNNLPSSSEPSIGTLPSTQVSDTRHEHSFKP
ncbi:SH2 domain-containing protein [Legionella sp. D16C41]|uniref:SH2 domain-containing protein n=1 Tax=Legionella sp. D16C41 TaxID=3402688 RepID=UPI003AF6A158